MSQDTALRDGTAKAPPLTYTEAVSKLERFKDRLAQLEHREALLLEQGVLGLLDDDECGRIDARAQLDGVTADIREVRGAIRKLEENLPALQVRSWLKAAARHREDAEAIVQKAAPLFKALLLHSVALDKVIGELRTLRIPHGECAASYDALLQRVDRATSPNLHRHYFFEGPARLKDVDVLVQAIGQALVDRDRRKGLGEILSRLLEG